MVGMIFKTLKTLGQKLTYEVSVYRLAFRDTRTPIFSKILLGLAIGYLALPFDLIPDFLPVIGHLDDLIIVPGLVFLALKYIPVHIVEECRTQVKAESRVS
ncbi:MAG TPA: YkvA family protein [Nitrospirales bacterium]|nr:YkvA family protein [Nitrospirales bacterium]